MTIGPHFCTSKFYFRQTNVKKILHIVIENVLWQNSAMAIIVTGATMMNDYVQLPNMQSWGSHSGAVEDSSLLWCDATLLLSKLFLTFQMTVVPPSSGWKQTSASTHPKHSIAFQKPWLFLYLTHHSTKTFLRSQKIHQQTALTSSYSHAGLSVNSQGTVVVWLPYLP